MRNARPTVAGEIDRSAADYAWVATGLKRGCSAEIVCAELGCVSKKAAVLPDRARRAYVKRTVRKATGAV